MKETIRAGLIAVILAPAMAAAQATAPPGLGTQEFGLSPRDLVQAIEKTEGLIARCMREHGFEYVAADYETVKAGMKADKNLPGLSEEEFTNRYGFGISTLYTGLPPQLSKDYSPGRVGLGERNVQIFLSLSAADQVAYNRALLGDERHLGGHVGDPRSVAHRWLHARGPLGSVQARSAKGELLQSPGRADQPGPAHEVRSCPLAAGDEEGRLRL